ncbi:MAG: hypothetical protein ACD_62C00204G0008 [uncultured bacterium]|nr:MAG: hypothetical protein ACD_62C00204G0008 [uncultured bacterium]HLD44230.1 nucleotidyl transferase AbiEii/AbiGii toxin family protein [bacterium]
MFNHLQQREIFHLMFLRHFCPKIKTNTLSLKGGVNLRFFFNSHRYSEDLDLDIKDIETFQLKDIVMGILESRSLALTLRPFHINKIIPPDINVAKQTETTQRFKVHLITASSENLFTKIEFSKRPMRDDIVVERVRDDVVFPYKIQTLSIPHYTAQAAFLQKIIALAERGKTQARDIYDLAWLKAFVDSQALNCRHRLGTEICAKAKGNIFKISFAIFRDTVQNYLNEEERLLYQHPDSWEELQLRVCQIIEEIVENRL